MAKAKTETPAKKKAKLELPKVTIESLLGGFGNPDNRRNPAWWDNGIACGKKGLTALQALGNAPHLDYTVEKMPSGFMTQGNQFVPSGKFEVVRLPSSPDEKHLSYANVTKAYQPIQNHELCELFNNISQTNPVTTIGEFKNGKIFYVCFAAGTSSINGKDEIKNYFLLKDTKDGKSKTTLVYTPVRVVCWNTFIMALKQAIVRLDIPHKGENMRELAFGSSLLVEMEVARDNTIKFIEGLTKVKVNKKQVEQVIAASLPYPNKPARANLSEKFSLEQLGDMADAQFFLEKSENASLKWEYRKARIDIFREGTKLLFDRFNDEHTWAANTAYGLYNAITENADWRRGQAGHAESTLFAYRASEKKDGLNAMVNTLNIPANVN